MGAPSDLLINKLIDLFEIAKRLQIFFHAAGQFLLHDSERGQEVGVSMRALREDHATLLVELQEVADMLPPPEELSNHYYTSLSQIFTYKAKGINKGWGVKSTAEEMDTGVLTDGIKLFTTGKVIYFDGTKLFRRDTTERQILQFSETAAAAKLVAGAIVRSIWKCIGQDVQHRVPTKLHHIKDKLRAEGGTEVVASFDENHIAHGERGGNLDDHAEARLLSQTDSRKYGPILYVSDPPCCHWYYVLHVPAVVRGKKWNFNSWRPDKRLKNSARRPS